MMVGCDDFISMSKIDSKVNLTGSKQKNLLSEGIGEYIERKSTLFTRSLLHSRPPQSHLDASS